MKYEAIFINGESIFVDADDNLSALKGCGKLGRIQTLKVLIEFDPVVSWEIVYERSFTEAIAYVNAYYDQRPVASVPLKITIESYQGVKDVDEVKKEADRLKKIWPDAIIKIQKSFARSK